MYNHSFLKQSYWLWLCSLMLCTTVFGQAQSFSWQIFSEMPSQAIVEQYQGQALAIRGFVYRHPAGYDVIAPIPNLRSCCLDKHHHMRLEETQISFPEHQVVTITGSLHLAATYMVVRDLQLIDQAVPVQGYSIFLTVFCVFLAFALVWLGYRWSSSIAQ